MRERSQLLVVLALALCAAAGFKPGLASDASSTALALSQSSGPADSVLGAVARGGRRLLDEARAGAVAVHRKFGVHVFQSVRQHTHSSRPYTVPFRLNAVLPVGLCYCRYDDAKRIWLLEEPHCKASLYQRAGDLATSPSSATSTLSLEKSWLDDYYSPSAKKGSTKHAAANMRISAHLARECWPSPPCACVAKPTPIITSAVSGAPAPHDPAKCYVEVLAWAASFTRIVPSEVLMSALSGNPLRAGSASRWLQADFPEWACKSYGGSLYTLTELPSYSPASSTASTSTAKSTAAAVASNPMGPYYVAGVVILALVAWLNFAPEALVPGVLRELAQAMVHALRCCFQGFSSIACLIWAWVMAEYARSRASSAGTPPIQG